MAKRSKKAKRSTRRGSRTTIGRAKVSKAKAKRARNECCPIIHVDCKMVTNRFANKKDWSVTREEYVNKRVALPPVKKCSVKLGNRTVLKNVTSDKAGVKVASLRKGLVDKRCMAVVESSGSH